MVAYKASVDDFAKCFKGYEVKHITRADNEEADVLSRLGSGRKPIPLGVFIENICFPSIKGIDLDNPKRCDSPLQPVMALISSWTQPYLDYLIDRKLPDDELLKLKIVQRAKACVVNDGQLYKQSITGVFLRCVSPEEGMEVLREIQTGDCGHHAPARSLVAKAFRHGFYWLTAKADANKIVKTCIGYQFMLLGHMCWLQS
jgi:hypothetical protein